MNSLPIVENCDGCGACCMAMRTPPFLIFWPHGEDQPLAPDGQRGSDPVDYAFLMGAPEEARRIMRERLLTPHDSVPDEAPCSWLDLETKRCRFHEHRPELCRDFPVGGDGCLRNRIFQGVAGPLEPAALADMVRKEAYWEKKRVRQVPKKERLASRSRTARAMRMLEREEINRMVGNPMPADPRPRPDDPAS